MDHTYFAPTRADGLSRLKTFLPRAGSQYAAQRNYDTSAGEMSVVSGLSPYLRHRMIRETEVLQAVLSQFAPSTAQKYIQEVLWRTYWKGWLELRPSVWDAYQTSMQTHWNALQTQSGLRQNWEAACLGQTGIDCFDHWAAQLIETGYMHNHARMWFASIWIFTLELPWELGADFFMRHLLDGDPASNTLSWRWVAGAQTVGKTYLARADNIEKYTGGRFRPTGLAHSAIPVEAMPKPDITPLPIPIPVQSNLRTGLLISDEDMHPTHVLTHAKTAVATLLFETSQGRSPLHVAPMVTEFAQAALRDSASRLAPDAGEPVHTANAIVDWVEAYDLEQVVTAWAPVGPTADELAKAKNLLGGKGIPLVQIRSDLDSLAWPHATHGFFKFKDQIPKILTAVT